MKNASLILAIVWGLVGVLALVGMFWNPSLFLILFLCVVMGLSYLSDWNEQRKK